MDEQVMQLETSYLDALAEVDGAAHEDGGSCCQVTVPPWASNQQADRSKPGHQGCRRGCTASLIVR